MIYIRIPTNTASCSFGRLAMHWLFCGTFANSWDSVSTRKSYWAFSHVQVRVCSFVIATQITMNSTGNRQQENSEADVDEFLGSLVEILVDLPVKWYLEFGFCSLSYPTWFQLKSFQRVNQAFALWIAGLYNCRAKLRIIWPASMAVEVFANSYARKMVWCFATC